MTSERSGGAGMEQATLSGQRRGLTGGMAGRVCVVTGATSGIGYETAVGLARMGARVIGVGRSAERCASAGQAIRAASGSRLVSFEVADLASQQQIRDLARRLSDASPEVDVLVNNAGTFTARRRISPDGMELQLAVNYLATFLLTHELMPMLAAARAARIINLGSGSHFGAKPHWMDMGRGGPYNCLRAYELSKLACILFTYELARRLGPDSRISTFVVDPGLVNTDMGLKDAGPLVRLVWLLRRRRGRTPAEGAGTSIFVAMDPGALRDSGRYWKDCVPIPSSPRSYDTEVARRLWELSERLTGLGVGRFHLPTQGRSPL